MPPADRAIAARLVLVERRDIPAPRDPAAARVRRYRLARAQVAARDTRDVPARFRPAPGRTPAGGTAGLGQTAPARPRGGVQ
jgi:hypothetical protein